ncbi:plastocyanin/azurin family copper-binding protein [Halobacillus seohaensis]|uniref:Plastocyanin/azurin family copper-binding protein n=1 Tax=Halobacillus seohaensis TaxID=447421 RepID=A0ABW2ETE3_9BACI
MGSSLYILLIITLLGALLVIWKNYRYRNKISNMVGMVIAMSLGMSFGLLVGYIFGGIFNGDLFLSTVLAMLSGAIIGFLSGLSISIIAVIEGLFAGLMGGMMGAMLGDMINPDDREVLLKILFFICFSTFLMLLLLIKNEVNGTSSFFINPFVTVILFGFIFIFINQFGPYFPNSQEQTGKSPSEKQLTIKAYEFTFSPNETSIQVGDQVNLSLINNGTIDHDLEIISLSTEEVHGNQTHHHNKSNSNVHIHASSGEEQSVSFIPLESGTYQFICTLPGHKESGMIGSFEVSYKEFHLSAI